MVPFAPGRVEHQHASEQNHIRRVTQRDGFRDLVGREGFEVGDIDVEDRLGVLAQHLVAIGT